MFLWVVCVGGGFKFGGFCSLGFVWFGLGGLCLRVSWVGDFLAGLIFCGVGII